MRACSMNVTISLGFGETVAMTGDVYKLNELPPVIRK